MEARYAIRQRHLLDEWQVAPEIFEQIIPRLDRCMQPFGKIFPGQVAEQHATTSVCGLLANRERKNVASIAYRVGHSRLPLQAFIGWDAWADESWRLAWRHPVKTSLGPGAGGLVCDPSAFVKSGRQSGGVARPWGGRLGKVAPCQVALYLGDVSRTGHTLVAQRLLLPTDWRKDTARLNKAGGPNAYRAYRTRHQVAVEMLVKNGWGVPHGWRAGDDERGRPSGVRRRLATVGERSLLAVPSTPALRALEVEPPESSGRG